MKKIFTLLSLVLISCAAMAQLTVTVNGTEATDGQTFDLVYNDCADPIWGNCKMAPEVFVTSTRGGNVTLSIKVVNGMPDVQTCFTVCQPATEGNNWFVEQTASLVAGEPKDAEIHYSSETIPEENPIYREVLVTVSQGMNTKAFTLKMTGYHSGKTPDGIASVNADAAKVGKMYNLAGQQLQSSAHGLVIMNGKKALVK